MRKLFVLGAMLAMASSAFAAPNVTNVTQKGSLLVWPDIRIDDGYNTLVRLQNDGSSDVDVICYWMDGNKNRVDFIIPVTKNQAVWFDARTGNGTYQVNRFPIGPANGIENPFLPGTGPAPYNKGLLACWAVDGGAMNQVKWNHLSGTATVYESSVGAYEYNAYSFFVPTGLDLEPVGVAGALDLNGVLYDSCPLYQIGQFTPANLPSGVQPSAAPTVRGNRLAIASCTLNLNQDWAKVWTKLQFDIWNEDEIKFTGAYECSDSWHETEFQVPSTYNSSTPLASDPGIDAAAQNFQGATLGTYSARYRVQGVKSSQCEGPGITTQAIGLVAVQSTFLSAPGADTVGTTLAAAGKFTGKIVWDPEGAVPEGGIR